MTSEVDVCNRALGSIGTRSTIAALNENSNEANQCAIYLETCRDELLRLAPWNCATIFVNLSLICAAPGTPENPSQSNASWQIGIPPPPWAYEYLYPSDCLRPLWICPQFTTGFASGVPITTAITGGAPQFWSGPPVRYKVGIDTIGNAGLPAVGGADTKVIWTNQQSAILGYIKRITNPDIMDSQFIQAWVALLAARLTISLTGEKGLANLKIQEANAAITVARAGDGNEGLTINDVTPDWIRTRGVDFSYAWEWSPNVLFDWGGLITMY